MFRQFTRTAAVVLCGLTGSLLLAATTPTGTAKKPAKKKAAVAAAAPAPAAAQTAAASTFTPYPPGAVVLRTNQMQGGLFGTPGIWNAQFAETLRPGQASSGVYLERYTTGPGGLVFTDQHDGWTVGVTHWLELSFDTTPYRRIRLTHPEQLTFAGTGGLASFNPQAPFIRNPLVTGPDNWGLGATIGLASQDTGAPVGVAVQFEEHMPYWSTWTNGVNLYGVNTTEPRFNVNFMLDKWLGNRDSPGEVVFNFGYQHNGTADPGGRVSLPLQDQFNYVFGEIFPVHKHVWGVVELGGDKAFGAGATSASPIPAPLYLNVGLRITPTPWLGLNAGYRLSAHTNTANELTGNPSGFVFGLSFGPPPVVVLPPPPPTPTLACQVSEASVLQGATVQITSTVSPQGLPYTYNWTTTGGQLTSNQGSATLNTTGLAPGMYTITGRVDNSYGGTADCTANVEVREPVRNPPTAACSVEPTTPVLPGTALTFSAQAASPDNRPLTYAWTIAPASAGHLDTTNQATVHLDTTGATPGSVTGTLTVTDDRGLSASCSAEGTIQAPPPPPQAALATTLQFKPNSSRVDNAAKAALDDVALRLQQDANAHAVIVGSATPNEVARRRELTPAATERLAEERAVNAKAYLVNEKGIAADRVEVRQTTTSPHQAEVWVVPQGASYTGSGQTFDENALRAPARRPVRRRRATPRPAAPQQ